MTRLSIELDEDITPVPVQTRNTHPEIRLSSLVLRAVRASRDARGDQPRLRLSIYLRLLAIEACRGTEGVRVQRGGAGQVGDRRVWDVRRRGPWRLL